jgi:osmotically-inducible protein OsmY
MHKHLLLTTLLAIHLLSAGCAITSGPINERRQPDIVLFDEQIEKHASHALKADDDIQDTSHVNVNTYNGMTLLTGEAPNTHLRNKIIAIIRVIPHVKSVHNEISIEKPISAGDRNNDDLITDNLTTVLRDIRTIPGFNGTEIKVVTSKGVVYLMGLVHKNEGAAAIDAAKQVIGVRKIVTKFQYID